MSDEVKMVLIIVGGLALTLCTALLSGTWYYVATTKAAMESGYSQSTLPGIYGVYWVKDGEVLK